MTFLISEKQRRLHAFIKEKKQASQSLIVAHAIESFEYGTENTAKTARSSVSLMLKKLESGGYISKSVLDHDQCGVPRNVWRITKDLPRGNKNG